jgi:hypothetical protein
LTIVFYISGHGLGHASRDIEVVHAILARQPGARVVIRTGAEPWLFGLNLPEAELQPCEVDTGVVQIDSLRLDEELTARAASRFYADFDARAGDEARILRDVGASVVIGDIPPLAFAAAARAGLASIALGNFTWDWIYREYPAFERVAPDVIPTIRRAYAQATLALRLPLHAGFETMTGRVRDVPFVARRSHRERGEIRRALACPPDRPIVLMSFGAYGVDLPIDALAQSGRLTLLSAAREPPPGFRYPDLVAASDVVISKPGYGIISECIANGAALLYTSRGHFAEYDVLVAGMPQFLRCRYIPQDDLLAGRWAEPVEALMAQPPAPERPRVDGAGEVATAILNLVIG